MQNIEVPAENEGDGAAQVEEVPVALDGTLKRTEVAIGNKGRRTQISNATRSSPRKVQPEKMPLDGTLTSNVAPVVNEEMTESSNPIRTSPTNVQQVRRSLEDKMKGTLFHTYIYIYIHT